VSKTRILVVDDEQDFIWLLKLNLESTGHYTVRTERSPANVLAMAREFRPDVIVLDALLPGENGYEIAARLHATAELRDVPVLFLTASVARARGPEPMRKFAGHRFLSKPVTVQDLVAGIEACLRETGCRAR